VIERGFVYRGLKPVYWCFDCGSSLAEFEIEYADKKSQTLDVGFKADDRRGSSPRPSACPPAEGKDASRSSGPPPRGPSRPTRR
jgi:isoleucyl-tRNA synthetase